MVPKSNLYPGIEGPRAVPKILIIVPHGDVNYAGEHILCVTIEYLEEVSLGIKFCITEAEWIATTN